MASPLPDEDEQYVLVGVLGHFGYDSPYAKTVKEAIIRNPVMTAKNLLTCKVEIVGDKANHSIRVKISSEEENKQ